MAKVVGPIKIKGTLDDLVFYEAQTGENLVRMKKRVFLTSKEFHSNPIYQPIIDQGKEFGFAAKLTIIFRRLVHDFNEKAKDQSYAGRAIKLLLEIIKEDMINPPGQRTLAEAMKDFEVACYLEGFEGNKLRPLSIVLLTPWHWNAEISQVEVIGFNPFEHIDWPEGAAQVTLCVGRTKWDFESPDFVSHYSEEVTFEKLSTLVDLKLTVAEPEGKGHSLLYFFIGFSEKKRKKIVPLKRIHNTVSLCKVFE